MNKRLVSLRIATPFFIEKGTDHDIVTFRLDFNEVEEGCDAKVIVKYNGDTKIEVLGDIILDEKDKMIIRDKAIEYSEYNK